MPLLRQLLKHPFSNAVIVLTIALLIGAVNVIYASDLRIASQRPVETRTLSRARKDRETLAHRYQGTPQDAQRLAPLRLKLITHNS